MKIRIVLSLIIALFSNILYAQKLTIPDSILSELNTKVIYSENDKSDSAIFSVAYPANYDSTKTYPVLLALSGGNQSEKIVNYCYAAWFRSKYFKDYITILPINSKDKNLMLYSPEDIHTMVATIKRNFRVTKKNWIIAGTSNGGRATFKFIAANPRIFGGGIVMPGQLEDTIDINKSWKHLNILLAYGDQDDKDWIEATAMMKEKLSKSVKKTHVIVLEGQGHILPIEFDIDVVYKTYFEIN
jgi:predicted esterase